MSPARRLLLLSLAVVVGVVLVALLAARLLDRADEPPAAAPQGLPGPVLLVPGYGGATGGLEVLAGELRAAGRTASVVALPEGGTGDLRGGSEALEAAVAQTLATSGARSVDVVGYSAGGVIARLWAREHAGLARRVVTLGSPHHGTRVAALGAAFAPGSCPLACQQLVPGSDLLDSLNDGDETPDGPRWLSLWTAQDETVTPPESARLEGATNVVLQELCPGVQVSHGQLPTAPLATGLVLSALSPEPLRAPASGDCPALSS